MKKFFKLALVIFLINLSLVGKALANEDDEILKKDLYQAIKETVDGKLSYQVNIKTVYGPSDINIYMANTDKDYLPAASTIKLYIGLSILDKIDKGQLAYTGDIKRDLDLSLRLSDNDATNRLIEVVGGFDVVNSYIKSFTKKSRTRLNRFMLGPGKDNTANAQDLACALYEIYRNQSTLGKDMANSLANSSTKRVKLLKNINPAYKTFNKTGELNQIQNDVALVETKSQAFIISVMTENENYMDTYKQILLLNKLGEKVAKAYERYENSYKKRGEEREAKIMAKLDTPEKKLAYAIYKNQVFLKAGKILLEAKQDNIDQMRPKLIGKMNEAEEILDQAKKVLVKNSKEEITSEEDFTVNLVRLIYTNKDLNSDLNKNLALAFYKNMAAVKAGEILLSESPKTSLNIRRPLLKTIKESEEISKNMDKFFAN